MLPLNLNRHHIFPDMELGGPFNNVYSTCTWNVIMWSLVVTWCSQRVTMYNAVTFKWTSIYTHGDSWCFTEGLAAIIFWGVLSSPSNTGKDSQITATNLQTLALYIEYVQTHHAVVMATVYCMIWVLLCTSSISHPYRNIYSNVL